MSKTQTIHPSSFDAGDGSFTGSDAVDSVVDSGNGTYRIGPFPPNGNEATWGADDADWDEAISGKVISVLGRMRANTFTGTTDATMRVVFSADESSSNRSDHDLNGYGTTPSTKTATDSVLPTILNPTYISFRIINDGPQSDLVVDWIEAEVTWSPPPNAPTLVSPSGTVFTTSPTFDHNPNNPTGGDTVTDVQIEVRRVSDNALFWNSGWLSGTGDKSYAGTALVSGTQYKWRARNRNTYGVEGNYSGYTNFTPTVNNNPVATQVSPSSGAQVGTLTPTLVFNYSDADLDVFNRYQLDVRRVSDGLNFWTVPLTATTAGEKSANQVSLVYAGTTLVSGTAYEWRVRVEDEHGALSNYTAYRTFTPVIAPNPPTVTAPSGLTNDLTPLIQGTYNQGTGGAESDFQYRIRQGASTVIYTSGDQAPDIATGVSYGGSPALSWGTQYYISARSKDNNGAYSDWSDWVPFNTNAVPGAPSNVQPNGSITSDQTPGITWQHNDADGDAQTAAQVELYDVTAAAYVTGYNPKTLTQSTQSHDVTETLTLTHQYQIRVRTKGLDDNGYGAYSDPVLFTVATAPTFAVDVPAPDDTITESSFTVSWAFSGGSGTQGDFRVKIFEDDGTTVVYDSTTQSGTAATWDVPSGYVHNGGAYYVQVSGHDSLNQAGQSTLVPFTVEYTPPAAITGLSATAIGSQI